MKIFKAAMLVALSFPAHAKAEGITCAISQIIDGRPNHFQNVAVGYDAPAEVATTDGLFSGRIVYQPDIEGWAISIKHEQAIASGFFDGSPKTPVLSLHVNGLHAQMNCFF